MVRPMSGSGPDSGGQSYVERRPVGALAFVASSVWIQQIAGDGEPYTQRNIPNAL
jgi:hypothetical protein